MYKPPNLSETNFTTSLESNIGKLLNNNKKSVLMEDFNMTTGNPSLSQFVDSFALSPLNTDPTCFRNAKKVSCICFAYNFQT